MPRSDREPREESAPVGVGATASASHLVEVTPPPAPSPDPTPPAIPTTPNPPRQFIACGKLDFYRITSDALQIFELSPLIHPPHIRGSKIARQTTQIEVQEPLNVVALSGKGALVIAKNDVYRYQLGETRAQRYSTTTAREPLYAWADPKAANAFWVRQARAGHLQQYTLSSKPPEGSKSPQGTAPAPTVEPRLVVSAARSVELPEFDGGSFTLLADGTPLYSTATGLRRHGAPAKAPPLPRPPGELKSLFADPVRDRYWSWGAGGKLELWSTRAPSETPVLSAQVPGVVIDVATDGDRVAVLSVALVGRDYRPTVSVFSKQGKTHRLNVAATDAAEGPPELDLCLVPGRPWVVVGTRRWLHLLDWDPPRLLAEW